MRFIVRPGMGVMYALGTDAAAPRFFGRHIRPGMTVVDVGVNRGQMALIFAKLVGQSGQVVAIEPAPGPFADLELNVRLNRLNHVRLIEAAAGDSDGELAFAYAPDRSTQGKLRDVEVGYLNPGADTLPVRAVTLDSVIDHDASPDVLKIDVEGAAAHVLRGAARILDRFGPNVYIELHGPEEQAGVRDELLGRGYVLETVDGREVHDPVAVWCSPLWCRKHSGRAAVPTTR